MIFPEPAVAAALPLHVLVRDFPETLALLRRAGVAVQAAGGQPLAALDRQGAAAGGAAADGPADGTALMAALRAITAWRAAAPTGPCDRAAARAAAHALTAAALTTAAG